MIPYGQHYIDEEDIAAVVDVLRTGPLTQGGYIETFERNIAAYTGARFAVAVASGTAALHLAARAAGVKPGRTLITSPITFVATANAALCEGGTVAFADIDPATINMCPDALAKTLAETKNTAAVVPVHYAGLPCDTAAIKSLADQAGAVVIEDAAHALGAYYTDGGRVGNCAHSAMTVFSFHPVKAIAAGEGGMITTNDETLYRHLLRLRAHGITKRDDPFLIQTQAGPKNDPNPWYYEMQDLGYHYRITDIQCALANAQLKKLDQFIARRTALALQYDIALQNTPNLKPAQTTGRTRAGHHIYTVRINFDKIGMTRKTLMKKLREHNIGSQVHYIPVPAHPYYQNLGFKPQNYPNAWTYYQQTLTLPLYYKLSNQNQTQIIKTYKMLTK